MQQDGLPVTARWAVSKAGIEYELANDLSVDKGRGMGVTKVLNKVSRYDQD